MHLTLRFIGSFIMLALLLFPNSGLAQKENQDKQNARKQTNTNPNINWRPLKATRELPEGSVLFTRGTIVSVSPPRPGSAQPYKIYISDKSDSGRLVIFQDVYEEIEDKSILKKGARVDAYVKLQDYKGMRQLMVEGPSHVRRSPGTNGGTLGLGGMNSDGQQTYFPMTIGAINMTTIGHPVRIRGRVTDIIEPSNQRTPWKIMVNDGTGEVMVIYWSEVHNSIPRPDRPTEGKRCEFAGIVNEYKGTIQLRIDDASRVTRDFPKKKERQQTETAESNRY